MINLLRDFVAGFLNKREIRLSEKLKARQDENKKWGFINRKDGKEVISYQFDDAWNFNEGLAAVAINAKWGFIDRFGNVAIPLKFDNAFDFHEGLARVLLKDKIGFINKTGEVIIPLMFQYASAFNNEIANVVYELPNRVSVHLDIDRNLNCYDTKTGLKFDCESCKYLNDKIMTGLCCKLRNNL